MLLLGVLTQQGMAQKAVSNEVYKPKDYKHLLKKGK